jgi:hypothetical protein
MVPRMGGCSSPIHTTPSTVYLGEEVLTLGIRTSRSEISERPHPACPLYMQLNVWTLFRLNSESYVPSNQFLEKIGGVLKPPPIGETTITTKA